MTLYTESENYKLYSGSMLDMLDYIEPNSISSIVTDPPYELGFMNKSWDSSGVAFQKETWEKCFQVLKPGGYMLVFGGSRTYYKIAYAIDSAGFEIRDTIMWLYGSGMPKSLNLGKSIESLLTNGGASPKHQRITSMGDEYVPTGQSDYTKGMMFRSKDEDYIENDGNIELTHEESKQWEGWGTCLKPSYEPIIIARKPCEINTTQNVLKYGVGGLNIDGCRIPLEDNYQYKETTRKQRSDDCVFSKNTCGINNEENTLASADPNGRFPSNIILTYDETDEQEVCGGFPNSGSGNGGIPYNYAGREYHNKDTSMFNGDKPQAPSNYNDNGSAARYFYCAKASIKDRDEGLEQFKTQAVRNLNATNPDNEYKDDVSKRFITYKKNTHPTVKPTELMQYLVRLVTPKNGVVLDPFNGSGSTGKACMWENKERGANYSYIGIELTDEYLPISKARIDYVINSKAETKEQLVEQQKASQGIKHNLLGIKVVDGKIKK